MEKLKKANASLEKQVKAGQAKNDEANATIQKLLAEVKDLQAKWETKNAAEQGPTSSKSDDITKESLDSVLASVSSAADSIKNMGLEWSKLDTDVKSIREEIAGLRQYSRINSLLFHGVKDVPKNLHGYDFAYWVVDTINYLLGNHLTHKLNIWHLEYAHILPTRSKGPKSVFIVKFKSRFMKHDIYDNRAKLKGSGVSITEHLTPEKLNLLSQVRNAVGFTNVWTSQTKILANFEGEVMHINGEADLEKLKVKCAEVFPDFDPTDYKAPCSNKAKAPRARYQGASGYSPYQRPASGSYGYGSQLQVHNTSNLDFHNHTSYPDVMNPLNA